MATKKEWRISASLISCFKSCAYRCYVKYVLGIIPDTDTDALRVGTNYHRLLEIMGMKAETVCPECANKGQKNPDCPLCEGDDIMQGENMDMVIRQLNLSYKDVPVFKTREEWLTERAVLLYSIAGYNWRYTADDYEVVAEEIKFSLPLRNPATGRALPNVTLDGKIDKIVRSPEGLLYVDEHKSTGSSVDSDSTLWSHLNLDTQTTLYPYAARILQKNGDLEIYGIKPTDPLISGVRYDVWHKPGIKPKKLTQGDSKAFVETGEYMGDKYEIVIDYADGASPPMTGITINGEKAEVEPGKKEGTFQIRETPDMFGARLLVDIGERPDFYFACKELARTDADFKRFEKQIYGIYKSLKFITALDAFWQDETQCEATFKCPYIPYCYNNVQPDPAKLPEGFKLTDWAQKLLQEKTNGNNTTK